MGYSSKGGKLSNIPMVNTIHIYIIHIHKDIGSCIRVRPGVFAIVLYYKTIFFYKMWAARSNRQNVSKGSIYIYIYRVNSIHNIIIFYIRYTFTTLCLDHNELR